jgi:DNA-binding CsgD family transcriptional regulator
LLLLEEQQAIPETSPFESFDLTKREVEVFHWVVRGKTNPEIAVILAVSPRTVQKHLEHVFKKLGVETRGAATLALNWRLGT